MTETFEDIFNKQRELVKDLAKELNCEQKPLAIFTAIADLKANQKDEYSDPFDHDNAVVDSPEFTYQEEIPIDRFHNELAELLNCEPLEAPIFSKIHEIQSEVTRLALKISGLDFNSCIAELAEFFGCEQTKEAVFRDIYTFKNKLNESKSAIRGYELDFDRIATMLKVYFDETDILDAIADLQKTLARSQEELRNNLTHFPSINFTHNRWEYDYANVGAMIAEHKRMADEIADHGIQGLAAKEKACDRLKDELDSRLQNNRFESSQPIHFKHGDVDYKFSKLGSLISDYKDALDFVDDAREERDRAIAKVNALEMVYDFTEQHRQDSLKKLAIAEKTIKILLDKIPD